MSEFITIIENHPSLTAMIIFILTLFFGIIGFILKKWLFHDKPKNSAPHIIIGGKNLSVGGSIHIGNQNVSNNINNYKN